MSVFKGKKLNIEIYGSSHGEKIGAKVSGFPDMEIDFNSLAQFTRRRKGNGEIYSTKRCEKDEPIFLNLVDNRLIRGDFEVIISNNDVKTNDYSSCFGKPRPSHADYCRYLLDGTLDFSGGGEFSGRLTAPICVVGGLCKDYLKEKFGVEVLAYVSEVGKVKGKSYNSSVVTQEEINACHESFPSLSNGEEMLEEIIRAKKDGDSVGATVECVVYNMKKGIGGSLFGGLEGKIAQSVYAIPGVKGVEFGDGFLLSKARGSEANDQLFYKDGEVVTQTNKAGGINGGVSNGNPITLRVSFRPTPSIAIPQNTVDLVKKENTQIVITGRHDACIGIRAVPVVESMVAISLLDELL